MPKLSWQAEPNLMQVAREIVKSEGLLGGVPQHWHSRDDADVVGRNSEGRSDHPSNGCAAKSGRTIMPTVIGKIVVDTVDISDANHFQITR